MALPPTTATTSGFEPCSIAGRMNSVSTAKLMASATSAMTPRSRPTSTTASAKMPGEQRHRQLAVHIGDASTGGRGAPWARTPTTRSWPTR